MTLVSPPNDVVANPPFRGLYTEEDLGLKSLLSGVTVTDLNTVEGTARPVPVWFHNPEREERRITYPNITINFTGERVAHEREHRGWVPIWYRYLQNIPFDGEAPPFIEWPIPMDFDYTVTVSARINQHISQISGALAQGRLHPRFAIVDCPGGTRRRLEVLSATRANGIEADKRLFRQIYRVRIPTEIEDIVTVTSTRVRNVVLTVIEKDTGEVVIGPDYISRTADKSVAAVGQYQSHPAPRATGSGTIFISFRPTSSDGADGYQIGRTFTINGLNIAIPNWEGSQYSGDFVPLAQIVTMANYRAKDWMPNVLGLTSDPPPADLVWTGAQSGQIVPASTSEQTFYTPPWPHPAPQRCYVSALWMPADKVMAGDGSNEDWVMSDFVQQPFTFTGTLQIEFQASSDLPVTGGTLTLSATQNDFTTVTDVWWTSEGGTTGGTIWSLVDDYTIEATFPDFTAPGIEPPITAGQTLTITVSVNSSVGRIDSSIDVTLIGLTVTSLDPTTLQLNVVNTVTITGSALSLVDSDGAGTGQIYFEDTTYGSYYYADSYTIVSETEMTAIWNWVPAQAGPDQSGGSMTLYVTDQQGSVNYAIVPDAATTVP